MSDQSEFDAALAAYVADVEAGVSALLAKAAGAAPATDFTAELAAISQAKANLDEALGITAPVEVAAPGDESPVDEPPVAEVVAEEVSAEPAAPVE